MATIASRCKSRSKGPRQCRSGSSRPTTTTAQAQVGPQIAVRRDQQTNQIEIHNSRSGNELGGNAIQRGVGQNYGLQVQNRLATDDAAALRTRLSTLEREAARMKQELTQRDERAAQAEVERKELREEVARLRKQLEAGRQLDAGKK